MFDDEWTIDDARKALERHGYLVVPCRSGIVAGVAPLTIDRDDLSPNGFAVYVEGLTSQEASDLLKAAGRMPAKPAAPAATDQLSG